MTEEKHPITLADRTENNGRKSDRMPKVCQSQTSEQPALKPALLNGAPRSAADHMNYNDLSYVDDCTVLNLVLPNSSW